MTLKQTYTIMTEIWKDVVGYEEYFQVSNTGKIFSKRSNKELKLHTNKKGYKVFATKFGGREGGNKAFRVHILVAQSFIDNPENKPTVNHIDGNKSNNHVDNLEWATNKEQMEHAVENGLNNFNEGVDCYNSRFTEDDIKYIRNIHIPRHPLYSARALARQFDVHHSVIGEIVRNVTYKNVK